IRIDTEIGRDGERLLDDVLGGQGAIFQQGLRGGLRVGAARADGDYAVLGLEHVAHAGDDQRVLAVGDGQHRLEPPQDAVGAPVLGELDRRAHQVALVLVELAFEALEQGERVRRAAGEAGEDAVLVQAPDFLRAAFDDDIAERYLAVAAERHARAAAHGKNGGAVEGFHREDSLSGEEKLDFQAYSRRIYLARSIN